MLDTDVRPRLFEYLGGILRPRNGQLLAAAGTDNHVHLLTILPRDRSLSDLLRDFKGNSSGWLDKTQASVRGFGWQDGYAASTVGKGEVDSLVRYLATKEAHHGTCRFEDEFVAFLEEHGVEYDPLHIWRQERARTAPSGRTRRCLRKTPQPRPPTSTLACPPQCDRVYCTPMTTVTALIPSYGRPDSLLRCLDGLLAGERQPDEIIVVARETDTETRLAAMQWPGRSAVPAFRVALVTEPGQIAAMNAGLIQATGDVITFPDDDCVPRPDWLRRIMAHYDDSSVGGAGGRDVVHVAGLPEPPTVTRAGLLTWYGRIIGNHHCNVVGGPRPVMHLKGVNMSFCRALLVPFDPGIRGPHINDTDISLAVYRTGRTLIFDPEAKVDHYPAARPDSPGGRDLLDPRLAFLDAHDWLYLLLKYQPWYLKPVNVLYVLLIGTRPRPGLLRGLTRPYLWRTTLAATRGALAALVAWRRPSRAAEQYASGTAASTR